MYPATAGLVDLADSRLSSLQTSYGKSAAQKLEPGAAAACPSPILQDYAAMAIEWVSWQRKGPSTQNEPKDQYWRKHKRFAGAHVFRNSGRRTPPCKWPRPHLRGNRSCSICRPST